MPTNRERKIKAVMTHYSQLLKSTEHGYFGWSPTRKRFTIQQANAFFLGVMLNQGQLAERAWDGGAHLVENHFNGRRVFWREVLASHHQTVKSICTSGYDGTSYGSVFCTNKFPMWLRDGASRKIDQYEGDPRKIWAVCPESVGLIYDRFIEFRGIGDALAKMAQFILVRNYRVAGGKKNQKNVSKTGCAREKCSF